MTPTTPAALAPRSSRSPRPRPVRCVAAAIVTGAMLAAACGGDDDAASEAPSSLTLVAYDSFPVEGTPLNDAVDEFTVETGIQVEILSAGDTGTMVSKAVLTAGNPEGDVMWGVDNTFLSRVLAADVFEPYLAEGIESVAAPLRELVPDGEATPVSFGDVCVNYDIAWFDAEGIEPPRSLDDLIDPTYADLLVVQNPATSSPGLAFVLATIAEYGDSWTDYWEALADNGVEVTSGWTESYYERFSWAGGGPRPLVVSYGSSPPAEVLFADPPRDDAPTGVVEATCFRQIEYVGVLRGTDSPEAAGQLVDHLIGASVQGALPLDLFVYPANADVELPDVFVEHAVVPASTLAVDPDEIDAQRADWTDEWTSIVMG